MVPSPRKRAPPTTTPAFNQTWDDADTAFLDPNSLPLSKIPRGWERRREVKIRSDGKEKKIWRRFNLRSRAATEVEDDEEQHDSRSRAVKKLQRMSPKSMDKATAGPNSKKRAFKATRWDRRKSVLPRKRTVPMEDSLVDIADIHEDEDDTLDSTREDNDSVIVGEIPAEQTVEPDQSLPEIKDRRATFTFTMDAATVDDLPDYESLDGQEQDATLTNFFRSPAKKLAMVRIESPKKVDYPQLPYSDNQKMETETSTENVAAAKLADHSGSDSVTNDVLEQSVPSPEVSMAETDEADREDSSTVLEALPAPNELMYPTLPMTTVETSPIPSQEDQDVISEDSEMSDVSLDLDVATVIQGPEDTSAESTATIDEEMSEEDFTEASLQLNIQREYEEALQEENVASTAIQEPQEEGEQELQDTEVEWNMDANQDHETDLVEEPAAPNVEDFETEPPMTVTQSPAKAVGVPQLHATSPIRLKEPAGLIYDSIADGLTFSFTPAKPLSADPTPRKLLSPPPPPRAPSGPDDATMTLALDDDTAILKDFLNRAAASKAEKAAVVTHRRESIQNRRDSDVIRHALASPRKILEDKDPNSPSKYDNDATLDLSQTLTLSMPHDILASATPDPESTEEEKSGRISRRSSRTKKSRLPALTSAAQAQTSKINIRRADGNEVVVLQKNDVQELANLTRANTRKNKQGAFGVAVRLLKVAADAIHLSPIDDSTKELVVGKNVRWDEQLAYYQENPETVAERESLSTPDELSMPDPVTAARAKNKTSKNSTPKVRRVRGLGTANGTPGKGLLAPAAFLPDAAQQEKEKDKEATPAPPQQQLPRPKASKIKKMPVASTSIDSAVSSTPTDTKLPSLDVAPVSVQPASQRKSRLAAPKKVVLPQSIPSEGKENAQRPGISDATPKKGIPAPKVMVPPTVGMESGLPRRRGRKM